MRPHLRILSLLLVVATVRATTLRQIKVVGAEVSKPATVASFFQGASPGDTIELGELESLCRRAEERMSSSQWFYRGQCLVVESVVQPSSYNVVLDVQDGFRDRYWGGNAFGGYGRVNAWGEGWELRAEAGPNRQTFRASRYRGSWNPWLFEAWIGRRDTTLYRLPSSASRTEPFMGGGLGLGRELPGDWSIWMDAGVFRFPEPSTARPALPRLSLQLRRETRDDAFSPRRGMGLALTASKLGTGQGRGVSTDLATYWTPAPRLTMAMRLQGTVQEVPEMDDHPGLGSIRGLRGPIGEELVGIWTGLAQTEARVRLWRGTVLAFADLSVETLLFFDAGGAAMSWDPEFEGAQTGATAAGTGLRAWFGSPVFVPVRLEYGVDDRGNGKLFFAVEPAF